MQLLTGQVFPTSGEVEVFGAAPAENAEVLRRICFVAEAQKYPESFRPSHVLRSAPWFFEHWASEFADHLVDAFRVPLGCPLKKLSRGQLSAVGVIVGLASRAPLTFFDEPYLGLDPVARQLFYAQLVADLAQHPRTVVLSTHLIDEVSHLLEHVVVDRGRVVLDQDADEVPDIRRVHAALGLRRCSGGGGVCGDPASHAAQLSVAEARLGAQCRQRRPSRAMSWSASRGPHVAAW